MSTTHKLKSLALALSTSLLVVSAAHAGAPAAKVRAGAPGANATIANGAVILAWTADAVALPVPSQLGRDKDFMAVIDVEPYSSTYGKVIWTTELESVLIAGGVPGGVIDGSAHNDPHHMLAYTSYTDAATKKKYTFAGGVISKNVFRFDITSVRSVPQAEAVVCGATPTQSSLTDDFTMMPNGNIMFTYMGSFSYGHNSLGAGLPEGGGTVTEFRPLRNAKTALDLLGLNVLCMPGLAGGASEALGADTDTFLAEYQTAPTVGPSAFVPRRGQLHADLQSFRATGANKGIFYLGNTNAAREAHPHGMVLSYDAKYLVAADYAVPVSIGAAAANLVNNIPGLTTQLSSFLTFSTFGVAVRVMNVNPATLDAVPAYGAAPVNGYADPAVITYGPVAGEGSEYSLAAPSTGNPAGYMRSISVVPDGPRREQVAFHEESEGLMPFAMFHQSHHCPDQAGWSKGPNGIFGDGDDGMGDKVCAGAEVEHHGSSVNSMCGGTMFYTANVRLPQSANGGRGPVWHAVYDVGPCSGVSYHAVIDDDRFIVQPIAGIESPADQDVLGPPVFDRDYPRQHSRRMLTLDFRPLISKGNGISLDCNGDGEQDEEDLGCGAVFVDPIQCHYPGSAFRLRPVGGFSVNSAVGRPLTAPGDAGVVIAPVPYAAATGTPGAAGFNLLVHNNRANDCPRVLGAVGQMETGSHITEPGVGIPTGAPTTETGNNGAFPGVGYTQFATLITKVLSDTDAGGAPTLTNINTAQNMNSNGGPHFTHQDRIGFCVPTGQVGGVATCKAGSYYDLTPDVTAEGSPRNIFPNAGADFAACAAGTSGYNGGAAGAVDPKCVQRVMFMQYFVELNHVPAPGTGSDGDRTICMMLVNRVTGETAMDPLFVDELTFQPCLDFDGAHRERTTFGLLGNDTCGTGGNSIAGDYCWPGARGGKGGAKPHGGSFERDGANLIGPGYFPPVSANPDGNI